ncbi:MAG: hypothetical protein ACE10G_03415 [Gemmatimonadales bacterium]
MAFPHSLVTRTAWFVSAVVAVTLISRELRKDDRPSERTTRVTVARGRAPQRAPARARVDTENIILSLTMLGDDATVVEGFTLTRPMEVRVLALGEALNGRLYDYGTILDATNREPVWKMELQHTHHAGGHDKNRMVDDVISLDAGSYLVRYVTDGSHSYEDWNAAAPSYPELWGITVLSPHGPVDRDVVRPYDDRDNDAVVARIVGVRDDELHERWFTLEQDAEMRVYAIGEGGAGEMYDYAWIEDAGGNVVWRMAYSDTDHAGGAQKNRVFDRILRISAGEYRLVYQSDDSHSFGDWNMLPPDDRYNYGVTIFRR